MIALFLFKYIFPLALIAIGAFIIFVAGAIKKVNNKINGK